MNMAKDLFLSQQAIMALFSVTNKLQMTGDKYLQDLTIRQMLAIPAIIHAPDGKATINHIARKLGTTKQSAKQIVDALAKKKYLSVAPSGLDKRAVDISITPEGAEAFKVCSERTDIFLADTFSNFTTQDLEALCGLLGKLCPLEGFEELHSGEDILKHHQNYIKRRQDHDI